MFATTKIGIYVNKKKLERPGGLKDFIDFISKNHKDINLHYLDMEQSLESQGPFRLILHKLNDEIPQESTNEKSKLIVNVIEKYLQDHPEVINIDPIEGQRHALDRVIMGKLLYKVEQELSKDLNVHNPRQQQYNQESFPYDTSAISFPVVCKTIQAGGSSSAHRMGIVFNEKGMHEFQPPFIAQEFYNHNCTIFKVFVIGNFLWTSKRPSVPNIEISSNHQTIFFDSQHPLGPQLAMLKKVEDKKSEEEWATEAKVPPEATLRAISKGITKHFGLTLFGFDVITQSATGIHSIIDINYFPGYKDVPEFHTRLIEYLKSRLE